jgi:hypothetical protein
LLDTLCCYLLEQIFPGGLSGVVLKSRKVKRTQLTMDPRIASLSACKSWTTNDDGSWARVLTTNCVAFTDGERIVDVTFESTTWAMVRQSFQQNDVTPPQCHPNANCVFAEMGTS